MYKVSIIVPVYNTYKYLRRCFDSLVNQSLKDIQVIIINDGSTDGSQTIIDEYVEKYSDKFSSYIKVNGGLSDARNYGITHVLGEYLAFLDSDDWVSDSLYEKLYDMAILDDCDVVCCEFMEVFETYEKISDIQNTNIYNNNLTAWNKIYRTKFWFQNRFEFKKGIIHEDVELIPRVLSIAREIGVVRRIYYFYERRNTNSITSNSKLYLKFFPEIISVLDDWNNKILCGKDIDFQKLIAELVYIYVMDINSVALSRIVFREYVHYLSFRLVSRSKRFVFICLLKVNFKAGFMIHKMLFSK